MHLEFIVEDSSGAKLLGMLIPRVIGDYGSPHTWNIHAYKGFGRVPRDLKPGTDAKKRILLDQLPKILRGYARSQGFDRIVVVVDSDRKDCRNFLNELTGIADACGRSDTLFRLAIEEIEAWYLCDKTALLEAYPTARREPLNKYVPDSICGTWEILADVVYPGGSAKAKKEGFPLSGFLKHEWAERIGPKMSIEQNESPSFRKFRDGLRRITS